MLREMNAVVEKARQDLPSFLTPNRVDLIRDAFDEMDADSEMTLDFDEMWVAMQYIFSLLFRVSVTKEQCEACFNLMDTRCTANVHYGEVRFNEKACDSTTMIILAPIALLCR